MKRSISRLITLVAFLVGLILFVRLWIDFSPHLALLDLSATDLVLIALLPIPSFLFMIARASLVLRALGIRLTVLPLTGIVLAGHAVGYLLPGGAVTELGFRTLFLTRAGLPANDAILAGVIDGFIRYVGNTVLLFVVAVLLLVSGFVEPMARNTVVLGGIVSLLGLIILAVVLFGGIDRWAQKFAQRLTQSGQQSDSWVKEKERFLDFFTKHRGQAVWAGIFTALGFFWEPLQVSFLLSLLDLSLPFWAVFWLTQTLNASRLIPVPAGLGVAEQSGTLFTELLFRESTLGFLVSLLFRVRILPYVLIGLLIVPFVGLFQLNKHPVAPPNSNQ